MRHPSTASTGSATEAQQPRISGAKLSDQSSEVGRDDDGFCRRAPLILDKLVNDKSFLYF